MPENELARDLRQRGRIANRRSYALGLFVQEFELMVDAARIVVTVNLGLPIENEPRATIILTHRALAAVPLFEVMTGVIGECMRYKEIPQQRQQKFVKLVSQISREYNDLANKRNTLVHGTWRVNPNDLSLVVYKFKGAFPGGIQNPDISATPQELIGLAKRCRRQEKLISSLGSTVLNYDFDPEVNYEFVKGKWKVRSERH